MKAYLLLATLTTGLLTATLTQGAEEKKVEKPLPYPLKTCLVTGEKLGGMGKPYIVVYKGQEFKFCCKGCEATFKKNPDAFVKKLKETVKKEAKPGAKESESNTNTETK
jgi:YHS domain-containing protein